MMSSSYDELVLLFFLCHIHHKYALNRTISNRSLGDYFELHHSIE